MTAERTRALRRLLRMLGGGRVTTIALLGALLLGRLFDPTPVEILRLRVFDFFQQLDPRVESNWPVLIVDIDEPSLKQLGQWPWPRTVIAQLVDRLAEAGAASVGFDMVFSEPDRTSPGELPRFLPNLPADLAAGLSSLPSNDAVLADSIRRYGRAVLGQAGYAFGEGAPTGPLRPPFTIGEIGGDPRPFIFRYATLLENLDSLSAAAAGRGSVSLAPEIDEVVRRVPAIVRVGDQLIPAQALELLRVATGQKSYAVRTNPYGLEAVVINGVGAIPTDRTGRIYVRFGPHDARRFVSAADVISGDVDPARIANHIVLIGASVPLLRDLRTTPIEPAMPGVEVHAQLLENILSQTFLSRPNYAQVLELGLVLGAGLLLVLLVPLVGARWTLGLLLALVAALAAGSWLAFSQRSLLLDASYPIVSATLLYLFLAYTGFTTAERQRKQVSQIFQHYVSPAQVARLIRDPGLVRLGGETKTMTVMFADIRDFTTISERFRADPQGLTQLINRVLTSMGDAVVAHEGTIDKYIGDSLMAFWNAPLDVEAHPAKACAAALDMLQSIERLNEALRAEQGEAALQIRIGAGINTGDCVVGNLGSERQVNYSVLGDPVNLASRLEGQSKTYGIPIILSEDTQRGAEGMATLELDLLAVKGRKAAARVYGLLGGAEQATTDRHRELTARQVRLLAAYRDQRWDEAEATVAEGLAATPELARLYELYRRRIAVYRAEPPGPGWDGVFVATEK
jgi:adenylate cyclase